MKAFDFDASLVNRYASFSRSFTKIRSPDLNEAIERQYTEQRFWPDSLLAINPRYAASATVEELVDAGELAPETGQIFRNHGHSIRLHAHQATAVAHGLGRRSFVVTTGTGSGKSLCFFIPIVDAIVRARRDQEPPRTRAIIVYPMNALANSQINEITKFIDQSGLPADQRPVVARYTGQETDLQRKAIAENPPDILLTNFMMAEMLLTRQNETDTRVIRNAQGLEFIVLDELHTYRGRQGADVAILVRRLRNRCAPGNNPICIGTSATMASGGNQGSGGDEAIEETRQAVADVASRLFGTAIQPTEVIDEVLARSTDPKQTLENVRPQLAAAILAPPTDTLTDDQLRTHPLAVWAELAIGLHDGRELKRRTPIPFGEAIKRLSQDSGLAEDICRPAFERFLTLASQPENQRGGTGSHAFLAFKLHRFISGAGDVFVPLTTAPRRVLFDGQLEDPEHPGNRLYPTRFCRKCGHEFHVVTQIRDNTGVRYLPRGIDDTAVDDDESERLGYLTPQKQPSDNKYIFTGEIDTYPDSWQEEHRGQQRIRATRKKRLLTQQTVAVDGWVKSDGIPFWFIPGKLGFCPCCHEQAEPTMRERSKLAGLSGEGRSSATTLLVSSSLQWMNRPNNGLPDTKRKLLGFTDNRQDAALQAGHFNDFLFVSLLRGAILRAVRDAGEEGLTEDEFGLKVTKALRFTADQRDNRQFWMIDAETGAAQREQAQRNLAKVLLHRVWTDLRRGWRYTNPNLTELGLVQVTYSGIDDTVDRLAADTARNPDLAWLQTDDLRWLVKQVLEHFLEGLAVDTEALDHHVLDGWAMQSRSLLQLPWAIDLKEQFRTRRTVVNQRPDTKPPGPAPKRTARRNVQEDLLTLRVGPRSRLGRVIRQNRRTTRLTTHDYQALIDLILEALTQEGLINSVNTASDLQGWRMNPVIVRLQPGPHINDAANPVNVFFADHYRSIADELAANQCTFWSAESREHTAQVKPLLREWREWRFRYEPPDREQLDQKEVQSQMRTENEPQRFLPVLFCSPTMELGVDISALNAVYLRNVPPTPANYAQRAGRAGRSGQAAVIVTYCAAMSPHDQYFFDRRVDMVAGIVRPPALDITNEELVRSHLHAVWLGTARLSLAPGIPEILDLKQPDYPLRSDLIEAASQPDLIAITSVPMRQVLNQIITDDPSQYPVWLSDPDEFIRQVAEEAPARLDTAFDRWRELYRAAHRQLSDANKQSENPRLPKSDRQDVKIRQSQANDQITLLEQGSSGQGSDFYSYRYLATEGFLPGYNFPRLPLYAFIPGERGNSAFLHRARFLAISEFGPRSLIYHEGRSYRVNKAKLTPNEFATDDNALSTQDLFICGSCGACHEQEPERCHACNESMAQQIPIKRTLRIDNVEAQPVERITANDEERVRQGFEIQTVFAWPRKQGVIEVTEAQISCDNQPLLTLQYANSADISRINKGLKRRKEKTLFGFLIDRRTGAWRKLEDEEDNAISGNKDRSPNSELDPADLPDQAKPVRIVPIVRDRKNALLLRFSHPQRYPTGVVATVQHALLRGIELAFQLEEGEVLGEPLPTREDRRTILTYEATEGGAGVLSQLIEDPQALPTVAKTALQLMHFDHVDQAIQSGDPKQLMPQSDACVRGCYRCLLSYYNQPDHESIDRTDERAVKLLIDIARSQLASVSSPAAKPAPPDANRVTDTNLPADASSPPGSPSGSPWTDWFQAAQLPMPESDGLTLAGHRFAYVWRSHRVAASLVPIPSNVNDEAEDRGWAVFQLPDSPTATFPEPLLQALQST